MSHRDELDALTALDYASARTRALFRSLQAFLLRQPNQLLSFEEVREKLHVGGPIHRGVRTVPISQIVGSMNRYRDFDRAFLPTQSHTGDRWRRVSRAWYEEVSLPPVLLYQVSDVYFVVDGNHRVSVARDQGQEYIDAEVRECSVKVPVTPNLEPSDLELLGEKVDFLERTGLDRLLPEAHLELTILGGFERMLEHIAVHKYFMGLDFRREFSDEEAVRHWYKTVYSPIVEVIRQSEILHEFPENTEADLYLWAIDHQHFLVESGQATFKPPNELAKELVQALDPDRAALNSSSNSNSPH